MKDEEKYVSGRSMFESIVIVIMLLSGFIKFIFDVEGFYGFFMDVMMFYVELGG